MKNIGQKPAEVKEKVKLFDEYKLPTKEAILKRNEFLKGKNVDPKTLKNEEFNTLAKELDDALGIGDISLSQELLVSDEEEATEDSPTPEAWKTSVIEKLDTSKLLEMDKNFENYKKTMNSVDKLAQERNDIVKAELRKRNSK